MSSWPELTALVVGVVLLAGALGWRAVARRRAAAGIRRALLDDEPERRRAAVFLAADRGIGRFADLLLERARQERSRLVRDALVEVVARSQWEPADRPELVELRLWAHHQREDAAKQAPLEEIDRGNRGLFPPDEGNVT